MRAHTKKHHTGDPVSKKRNISAKDYLNQTSDGRPWRATSLAGLRYREDYTQKGLGDLIGVNQANISAMERGMRPIGKSIAKRLAKVFKVDYREFL